MTIQNPIGLQLARLAARFPSGATETTLQIDLAEIERIGVREDDITEAVTRIMHSRETRTYPPLAELLRRTREAAADRMKARDETLALEAGQPTFAPDAVEMFKALRALAARGYYWCARDGFTFGVCEHTEGGAWEEINSTRCDPPPLLSQCLEKLAWCEQESVPFVVREAKAVRGWERVGDVIDQAMEEVPF